MEEGSLTVVTYLSLFFVGNLVGVRVVGSADGAGVGGSETCARTETIITTSTMNMKRFIVLLAHDSLSLQRSLEIVYAS